MAIPSIHAPDGVPEVLFDMIGTCIEVLSHRSVRTEYDMSNRPPHILKGIVHEGNQGTFGVEIHTVFNGETNIRLSTPSDADASGMVDSTWFKIHRDERWAGSRYLDRTSIRGRLRHVAKMLDRAKRQKPERVREDVESWNRCVEVVRAWAKTKSEGFAGINAESPWRGSSLRIHGKTTEEAIAPWFARNVPRLLILQERSPNAWSLGPASHSMNIEGIEMDATEIMRIASRNPEAFA